MQCVNSNFEEVNILSLRLGSPITAPSDGGDFNFSSHLKVLPLGGKFEQPMNFVGGKFEKPIGDYLQGLGPTSPLPPLALIPTPF